MKKLEKIIELTFYFFLFLLPWQTRLILNQGKLEWGRYSLYTIDIIFILLLVLFCLNLYKKGKSINNIKKSLLLKKTSFLILFFLIISFLSIFWAKKLELAFYWWLRIFQGIILFFLLQKIKFDFIKAGFSLVFAGLIQSFLGIYQFINQKVFASKWLGIASQDPSKNGVSVVETVDGRLLRVYGSLPHPNILAGFLVFLIFLSFVLYFLIKKNWQKYFLLGVTGLMTLTLFLTYSRSAFVSLFFTFILSCLSLFKRNLNYLRLSFFKFFSLVVIIILVFFIFSFKDLMIRIKIKGRLEEKSINERILNFYRAIKIVKENFLFGIGIGNYTFALFEKYPDLAWWNYQPVANIYLLILAEIGVIGLISFLLILFSSLFKSNLVGSIFFIPLLIIGLFDHWLFSLPFGILLFWLNVGFLWKNKKEILV